MNCICEFHAYRLRESRDHVAVLTIQAVVGPAEDPDVDSACLPIVVIGETSCGWGDQRSGE